MYILLVSNDSGKNLSDNLNLNEKLSVFSYDKKPHIMINPL